MDLFNALKVNLGERGVIAEDLGYMTESVRQLVRDSGYPNMKVLQFAFDPADVGGASEYAPHNFNNNCFMYTGTHDNETVHGWLMGMPKAQKKVIREYLSDGFTPDEQMWRKLVDVAMMCVAKTCIIPLQDWLGLPNSARMNTPGTVDNNWTWRLLPGALTSKLSREVLMVTKRFGRANWDGLNALKEKKNEQKITKEVPADEKIV
jgi:4-alpha-glucanotransferase